MKLISLQKNQSISKFCQFQNNFITKNQHKSSKIY